MSTKSKESLEQALHSLAKSAEGRPEAARLRDVLPAVEQAMAAGVSRAAVLATLHERGFRMSLATFAKTLYRLRRERVARAGGQGKWALCAPAGTGLAPRQDSDTALPTPPTGDAALNETATQPAGQDVRGLDPKARRERRADRWLPEQQTGNPLLAKVKKDHQT